MKQARTEGIEKLVEHQLGLWQTRRKISDEHRRREADPGRTLSFITLSRDAGNGGVAVAHGLAERLGWKVFDSEIVDFIAQKSSIHKDLIGTLDESARDFVTDAVMALVGSVEHREYGSSDYREALFSTMAAIAQHGEAVILGRGGNIVLEGAKSSLRVRLIAPRPVRAGRLAENLSISAAEADKLVRQTDRERRTFIRKHFDRDIDDPCLYDLVINTAGMTTGEVVSLIWQAARIRHPGI
jgi:cytidylate kinase